MFPQSLMKPLLIAGLLALAFAGGPTYACSEHDGDHEEWIKQGAPKRSSQPQAFTAGFFRSPLGGAEANSETASPGGRTTTSVEGYEGTDYEYDSPYDYGTDGLSGAAGPAAPDAEASQVRSLRRKD